MHLRERANKGLHKFLIEWLQQQSWFIPNQLSLMDIGCGSGAFLKLCQEAGIKNMHGLDMDTKQFGLSDIPVSSINLDIVTSESFGLFNVITALEILEHLHNPGNLFQLISSHLAPDGKAVITTPNIHSIAARLLFLGRGRLPHFDNKSDATHVYPVYLENIQRILPTYGLKLSAVHYFPVNGHQIYSRSTVLISKALSLMVPEKHPGDNLMLLLEHL